MFNKEKCMIVELGVFSVRRLFKLYVRIHANWVSVFWDVGIWTWGWG